MSWRWVWRLLGPILIAGSMSLTDIVNAQQHIWFIVFQPVGALIYMIATIAEINRAPFDMPEAEQELTAGYHVEYSGMKFALFFMAEYIKMIAISMIGASLFLGGFQGPFWNSSLARTDLSVCQSGDSALWPDLDPRNLAAHPL